MRTALLLLVLVTSLAACGGKKKSAANPSNTGTDVKAGSGDQDHEEQDMAKPDDPDDATKSSDPCEGGE